MNTMKMPGFTAENALYNSGRKYNMPSLATERSSSGVVPQAAVGTGLVITIDPVQCERFCYWICGRYGCFPYFCHEVCF